MVRSFSGTPLEPDVLDSLLALAAGAPTAGNARGRSFVVLRGDETAPYWQATTTEEWRGRSRRWPGLSRAPVVLIVLVNPRRYMDRYAEPDKVTSGLAGPGPGPASGAAAAAARGRGRCRTGSLTPAPR